MARCVDECAAKHGDDYLRRLTARMFNHYRINIQDERTFATKMYVRDRLVQVAMTVSWLLGRFVVDLLLLQSQRRSDLWLLPVGSTVNGCGAYSSDMDLCLLVPDARNGSFQMWDKR